VPSALQAKHALSEQSSSITPILCPFDRTNFREFRTYQIQNGYIAQENLKIQINHIT